MALAALLLGLFVWLIAFRAETSSKPAFAKTTREDRRQPLADAAAAQPSATDKNNELRRLLYAWSGAQNAGDFDKYSKLFSPDFTGVRRTGAKKRHFVRASWLRDRKRMFRRPVKVVLKQVKIHSVQFLGRITFEQTWSSGRFKDTGGKQLVTIREGGEWRIVREDMLSSDWKNPNACDPKDESCSGDAEYYSNVDWSAYSDDADGQKYVSNEIKRRYRADVFRCLGGDISVTLSGVIVTGGRVPHARVSGGSETQQACLRGVVQSTWLFADPREAAADDYAPRSIKQGVVPFRVQVGAR